MNRLQSEIHQRQIAHSRGQDCKRMAKTNALNILQYGQAAANPFNNFATPEKSKRSTLRASSIDVMTTHFAGAKRELNRLVSMRNKDIRKPFAAIYMARARRLNDGVAPADISEALTILIREQMAFCKGLVASARQYRVASMITVR